MKTFGHIKLAAFIGLLVGILHGTIDIIARLIVLRFEWFELYQTLLISSITFALIFIIISILIEFIRKIMKLKITKKTLFVFYGVNSILLLILFYVATIVNRDLLSKFVFFSPTSLAVNLPIFLILGLSYILLLTKGKELVYSIISFFNKRKIRKIINNIIFIVIVFIIISLIIDLYLINYISGFAQDSKLGGYPNIILISLDAVRTDHLSLYGYPLETSPNLDKLSKESLVFENSISSAVWTIISHGAIFTGKYASHFDPEHTNKGLNDEETTLAEILRVKGYNTVGFISAPWIKAKFGLGQGFVTYKDRLDFFEHGLTFDKFSIKGAIFTFLPIYKSIIDTDRFRTAEKTNKFVFKWLDENKDDPFFMFVHYSEIHDPYVEKEEFRKKFTNDTRDFKELKRQFVESTNKKRYGNVSKDVVSSLIKLYDAAIYNIDYEVGNLLRKLDELGIKNNTIIIITADHGEEFYEHGYFLHGRTLYQELIHVPLIIYYPKEFKAKRIKEIVSTIDIFPTVLDVLDMEIPDDIDGVSLLPLINNPRNYDREYVKSELFGLPGYETEQQIAVFHGDWKLIEVKPEVETIPSGLYNLRTDPKEQKNLYDIYPAKRESLKKYISNGSDEK